MVCQSATGKSAWREFDFRVVRGVRLHPDYRKIRLKADTAYGSKAPDDLRLRLIARDETAEAGVVEARYVTLESARLSRHARGSFGCPSGIPIDGSSRRCGPRRGGAGRRPGGG